MGRTDPGALWLRWRRSAPLGDLGGDIRRAVRMLRHHPGFAAAAIATMALGAGATAGVISIVEAILLRPLPYVNADRLLAIRERDPRRQGGQLSWADFSELSGTLQTFSEVAGYSGASRTLTGVGRAERLPAIEVTSRFFDVLGVTPAFGRSFTDADMLRGAPAVVILTDAAWRRRLAGDPTAIGRTIVLSGVPHTVIGVLPPRFVFPPRADPELWVPFRPSPLQQSRPSLHVLDVIALTRGGVTRAAAREELRTRSRQWNASGAEWHAATTLTAPEWRDDMVAGVRPALLVLLGAAFLVLAASAVNVSALVLARASARTHELGVRAALGASRWRIVRQLAVESCCIAIAGSALGLALGTWAVALIGGSTPARFRAVLPYADPLSVSPIAAALSVGVTVLAVVVAGIAPALRAARPVNPLFAGSRLTAGRRETRLRQGLVAAQIALAVVLLAGAVLVGRSVLNLSRVSAGFDLDGIVTGRVNFPAGRYAAPEETIAAVGRILDGVRAAPGVRGAEAISQAPLGGRGNAGVFSIAGRSDRASHDALMRNVTPGYRALLGVQLIAGRELLPSDTRGALPVVLVNRALARAYFGATSPIGERIVFEAFAGKPEWTIVGVAADEQFDSLDKPMAPVVYFPFAQNPQGSFSLVVRAPAAEAVVPAMRAAIASFDAELPLYGVQILERTAADSDAMFLRSLVMRLLAWFALAAVLLGGVGVYGVLAQTMTARTREIGVRLALGATHRRIARLVLVTGAAPAAVGLAAGVAVAFALAPAVRSLLFGVTALDVPSFAGVVAVLAAVTAAACALPAWRAIRLPVTAALRSD